MKQYLPIILQWFKKQQTKQQYLLVSCCLLFILLTTVLCLWVLRTDYAVLFSQLDPEDAHQIIQKLDEEHIEYRIKNQGQEIHIPQNLIEKTRLTLMGKGMQFSGTLGFELFDKSDFGMTDFSQKINYQRALQGELERTINSLNEVQLSRVHLVIPENRIFQEHNNPSKAAVTLHLRAPLNKAQIASIQQLIKASVSNLETQQIIIIDQQGNRLTAQEENPETSWFAQKKEMERYLAEKVLHMLHTMFEPDQVMVHLDLTLNHDQRELERIKPDAQGIVTHEKEIQHSTTSKKEQSSSSKDITREKSYQSGTQKEHIVHAAGTIEHLSAGVLVPEKTSPSQIIRIRELVKSIVGFHESRGDFIQVEALIPAKMSAPYPETNVSAYNNNVQTALFNLKIPGFLLLSGGLILFVRHQQIRKKRRLLLQELTLWLENHE